MSESDRAPAGGDFQEGRQPGAHEAGGPGDGMRTGGSAGTASGHDPMADEIRRQQARDRAEPPSTDRTKGDGAGTV
jgi:hypothetical protein